MPKGTPNSPYLGVPMRNRGVQGREYRGSDYLSGGVSGIPNTVINTRGDWRQFLPVFERQSTRSGFDTMACVTFSALNCLETLHKFRYGSEVNYSDRFIAKESGTTQSGNSMSRVGDTIRSIGCVDEDIWPMPPLPNWTNYYSVIPVDVVAEAQDFLREYTTGYEFLSDVEDDTLRDNLKKGPLQITIGTEDIERHAIELVYVEPSGIKWVFDHYGSGLTQMDARRKIFHALRYHYIKTSETNPIIITEIMIPNNALVFMADSPGDYGLYVNGKMYVDDLEKLTAQFISTNSRNGVFSGGASVTVPRTEWDKYPRFSLKNNPLP